MFEHKKNDSSYNIDTVELFNLAIIPTLNIIIDLIKFIINLKCCYYDDHTGLKLVRIINLIMIITVCLLQITLELYGPIDTVHIGLESEHKFYGIVPAYAIVYLYTILTL